MNRCIDPSGRNAGGGHRHTVLVGPIIATGQAIICSPVAGGVLTVSSILSRGGIDARPILLEAGLEGSSEHDILRTLAGSILKHDPEIVGFSANCGFYALTLLTAAELKRMDPSVTVVFGGPQPSVLWRETLDACPWIDAIVVGEAELTALPIWRSLGDPEAMSRQPGLAWRAGGEPRLNFPPPRIDDADDLPEIEWDLVPEGALDGVTRLELEAGRGCPYNCAFCSTSSFWGRRFRIKSPSRLIADMHAAEAATGFTRFSFVHDLLTASRDWMEQFCDEFMDSGLPYLWNGSARVDDLDTDLMELMASAGCYGLFLGVESGSERVRDLIGKPWDPARLKVAVSTASRLRMSLYLSFIIGFPYETEADLADTIRVAIECRRIGGRWVDLIFHTLAPLPDTALYDGGDRTIDLDPYGSHTMEYYTFDAPACRAFIREYPELCTAACHYRSEHVPRDRILALGLIMNNLSRCPATLAMLDRIYGGALPEMLCSRAEALRQERVGHVLAQDRLVTEMERFLAAVIGTDAERIPWWKALYRYESARFLQQMLPERSSGDGIVLDIEYDAKEIAGEILDGGAIPPRDFPPRKCCVWCYSSPEGRRRTVIPRSLGNLLRPAPEGAG
ncbi:MAG: hypothetical protein AVO35_09660 [Candidatus Aegiribacteria sp. MLS_C]|nr:MAG: hypothetical protein AVO35_09660 [Candidatus Aegiribacteria sp. MLS_C]